VFGLFDDELLGVLCDMFVEVVVMEVRTSVVEDEKLRLGFTLLEFEFRVFEDLGIASFLLASSSATVTSSISSSLLCKQFSLVEVNQAN